jgi:hypothetical protein
MAWHAGTVMPREMDEDRHIEGIPGKMWPTGMENAIKDRGDTLKGVGRGGG